MQYQTRHLVALGAMKHEGRELSAGDSFDPTEVDAKYYLAHKLAIEPMPKAKPPPAPPQLAPRSPRGSTAQLQRSYPVAKSDDEGE